jgi:RimJ/RimL family protein N-acetyltransferase
LQILDPFNRLFDEGHTALAQLSNAQAEQGDEALGGAARRRAWHWRRRYQYCGDVRIVRHMMDSSTEILSRSSGRSRMQLLTPRLILRSWMDSDRQPFAEMSENAAVMEHLRPLATRDACNAWIDFQITHQSSHGFCLWALESRASGVFMGAAGLLHVGFDAHFTPAVEAGWRLARPFWGQGFAVEAAEAALQFGFEEIRVTEVVAHASIRNGRSRRVMAKLGMSHDGAEDFDHPRIPESDPLRRQVLYRLTRDVWLSQRLRHYNATAHRKA